MKSFFYGLLMIIMSSAIATACALFIVLNKSTFFPHDATEQSPVSKSDTLTRTVNKSENPEKMETINALEQSAMSGNVDAQFTLGVIYYLGTDVAKNDVKARFWFKVAYSYGSVDAQVNLASMYKYGEGGNKDIKESVSLYSDAARKGSLVALYNLGKMYLTGDSLTQNKRYALSLLNDSCNAGYEKSCNLLKISTSKQ